MTKPDMNDPGKLIVFDWDGTLMDSEARIVACMRAAIRDTGLAEHNENSLKNIIGLGLYEALNMLYPDRNVQDYARLTDRYRHHFLVANDTPAEMFEGACELVRELHAAGHFLAVATGKGRKGLDRVLIESELTDYFHYTRCADETHSKPHPQMLLDILDFTGVEAEQAIMIGDTEYDLQMANNAGVKSLAVSYGVHDKQRLLACGPQGCVDSVAEMKNWLLNYGH